MTQRGDIAEHVSTLQEMILGRPNVNMGDAVNKDTSRTE